VATDLATRVVSWQKSSGRNNFPWQQQREPYRVWLSEIMLQQTQVATVLDYYPRFLKRFPDVSSLAGASLDEVLGLWSGLGYYSRAHNLHSCALAVMALHGGVFPKTAQALQTLPGIGRSTAAAIASLCFGERVAILDGNVKRLLARVLGFDGDLSFAAQERRLWDEASRLLPRRDLNIAMPRYTQGVMDLGATVCTAKQPACGNCPLASSCVAHRLDQPDLFPVKTRKLRRTAQSVWLLWAQAPDGAVWLSKRPITGVWGGLYCFPWLDERAALEALVPPSYRPALQDVAAFTHVLTHKDLHLHPVRVQLPNSATAHLDGVWMSAQTWPALGLPAPVRKLLEQLK
jgi:A/G-specific adenine glycosylase